MVANIFERGIEETGTDFDMSILTLYRIHYQLAQANIFSGMNTAEGVLGWLNCLMVVDREINPFLRKAESEEVTKIRDRVKNIPDNINNRNVSCNLNLLKNMLDEYERKLRWYMKEKKLYMRSREDVGTSILR